MAAIRCTMTSGSNIAVIKYWGKADVKLNTPINSSVSYALNQSDMCTTTTVVASTAFGSDRMWLNGTEESVEASKRIQAVLREVRKNAGDRTDPATGEMLVSKADWAGYKVHIISENNFPTAAGLASSAAGYACMGKPTHPWAVPACQN